MEDSLVLWNKLHEKGHESLSSLSDCINGQVCFTITIFQDSQRYEGLLAKLHLILEESN